jgi:hypothetical protein
VWFSVLAAGVLAGRYGFGTSLNREIAGVAFIAAGTFMALAPSFLASSMAKLDQTPPKEFSSFHAERFRRKLSSRRRVFWLRYFLATASGAVLAVVGAVLRSVKDVPCEGWFIGAGTGAVFVGSVLSVLAVMEYRAVTEALRGVADKADAIRRKKEFLKP